MSESKRKRLLELDAKGKPVFTYRRAAETNVAATIARYRRQLKEQEAKQPVNVKPIRKSGT